MHTPQHHDSPDALRCMEVWGGAAAADSAFAAPGVDVYVYARPYAGGDLGGDVHYISTCGGGNIARLAIADVAGHGVAVAPIAESLRRLMRRHINNPDLTSFARALNAEFPDLADDGRFATAVVATYVSPWRSLITVNAGHPRPLWRHASTGEWTLLVPQGDAPPTPRNLPLGVIEPTEFEQFAVRLGQDDLVLFYTDALSESRNKLGEMLGERGLLELAQSLPADQPEEILPALLRSLSANGATPAEDDMTLVLMHHNGRAPRRLSFPEKLSALARYMGLTEQGPSYVDGVGAGA